MADQDPVVAKGVGLTAEGREACLERFDGHEQVGVELLVEVIGRGKALEGQGLGLGDRLPLNQGGQERERSYGRAVADQLVADSDPITRVPSDVEVDLGVFHSSFEDDSCSSHDAALVGGLAIVLEDHGGKGRHAGL